MYSRQNAGRLLKQKNGFIIVLHSINLSIRKLIVIILLKLFLMIKSPTNE